VEDDHVDRLGVQAWQHVELTSTNRSSGLIVLMTHARDGLQSRLAAPSGDLQTPGRTIATGTVRKRHIHQKIQFLLANVLRRPGGPCEEPKPDPIPNSAVKLLSADGTLSQDMGE
jgi:hypothetical protein